MLYVIQSTVQSAQRYKTIGDWQRTNLEMLITVTQLPDPDMTFLIAVHELIECYLCERRGITQRDVDEWDLKFCAEDGEPGDHPNAPYRLQHQAAESVERHLAQTLGVDWTLYQKEVDRALEGK